MALIGNEARRIDLVGLGLLCLLWPSAALSQEARSDSDVLRSDVLPALELSARPEIQMAFRTYTDCYSAAVEKSRGSALDSDVAVRQAEQTAQKWCGPAKLSAMTAAEKKMAKASPSSSSQTRSQLLGRVRRQLSLFSLMQRYQRSGRATVFQRYLDRIGREGRTRRDVVMLSGE